MKKVFKTCDEKLYIYSMGKRLQVTAIFTNDEDTNRYCELHDDMGVIAEFKPFIFVANVNDRGVRD